jgi:hypothetical protein
MVMTVSTHRISRVQEDPKYLELWISFYPEEVENQPPKLDVEYDHAPTLEPQDVSCCTKQINQEELNSIHKINNY